MSALDGDQLVDFYWIDDWSPPQCWKNSRQVQISRETDVVHDVVHEHNRDNPFNPVFDPSSKLIGITMLFIQWYNLYWRRFPPKDGVDVQDMTNLGEK